MALYVGGPGVNLPPPVSLYPATIGSNPQIPQLTGTNLIDLPAGSYVTIPAGNFFVRPGKYCFVQVYDPVLLAWRSHDIYQNGGVITSDGENYRVANLTGCVIGVKVTTSGSGYTSAPTVTASGVTGFAATAVIGGAVGTVTVGTAGTGYNLVPIVEFAAPAPGGVQATGIAVLSGTTIGSITVNNQGAGYGSAPAITIIPNPLDPAVVTGGITPAAATCTLSGAGSVTAVVVTDPGTPQTAVPTIIFSTGSAAGTAVMDFVVTGYSATAAGSGLAAASIITTITSGTAGTPAWTNPAINQPIGFRPAWMLATVSGGTLVAPAASTIVDGGHAQAVPSVVVIGGYAGSGTVAATANASVGGVTDTVFITPL